MNSYDNMIGAMYPIGAYSLNVGDLVCKELWTYAQTFDDITREITDTIRECFVSTSLDKGLEAYERIVGAPRDDLPEPVRRSMVTALLNVNDNDFTLDGIQKFFDSLDFECVIYEDPQAFDLLIVPTGREYSKAEREYIRKRAADFLPCHLTFTIEFRTATWDTYDALDMTFDEWDALDLDWDALDRYEGE